MIPFVSRSWLAALAVSGFLFLEGCGSGNSPVINTKAPDLYGKDILTGDSISPDLYKGKVRMVVFWASWCQPCLMEIPTLLQLQSELADSGLQILSINLDEDRGPSFAETIRPLGIRYPVLAGGATEVAQFGSFQGLPTSFLIDRDGHIRDQIVGLLPHGALRERVLAAIHAPANNSPVQQTPTDSSRSP